MVGLEVTSRGLRFRFPTGWLDLFTEDFEHKKCLFLWWWRAIVQKDIGPRCRCGSCECSRITFQGLNYIYEKDNNSGYCPWGSLMGAPIATPEMKKAAKSKDFGKIRIYLHERLFITPNQTEKAPSRNSRNAESVLQTIRNALQQAILNNNNDEDVMRPDQIVQHLAKRFREDWPEQWELAEKLWKQHIHLLWDKLSKRLRLVRLFREARVRANDRLYQPGSERHQECMQQFQFIQQKLIICDATSSSENSEYFPHSVDKKRKSYDDDDNCENQIVRSVKQRKFTQVLVHTEAIAEEFESREKTKFVRWTQEQCKKCKCTCELIASQKMRGYKPNFRSSS